MTSRLALLLVACAPQAIDPDQKDRLAYLDAARTPSDPNACAPIRSATLQAECIAMSAGELSATGRVDDARTLCGSLEQSAWRDECRFLVAEKSNVPLEQAGALCDESGAYASRCRGHLLRREAAQTLQRTTVGSEAEALEAVITLTGRLFPPPVEPRARGLVAEHLAGRLPGEPFSRAHCGAADRALCVQAYIARVQKAARSQQHGTHDLGATGGPPWQPVCSATPTLSRVEAFGFPTWKPDMQPLVSEAWAELCDTPGARAANR